MGVTLNGGTSADVIAYNLSIQYLMEKVPGMALLLDTVNTTIDFNSDSIDMWDSNTNIISWDGYSGLTVVSATGEIGVQSAALGLYHELMHAVLITNKGASREQVEAMILVYEAIAAEALGEPTRANYNSTLRTVKLNNATQHTDKGVWKQLNTIGTITIGGRFDVNMPAPTLSNGGTGGGGGVGGNPGNSGSGPNPSSPPEKEPPTGTPVYPIPDDPELPNEM